jgi:alpha-1,2-mannosyltransferase
MQPLLPIVDFPAKSTDCREPAKAEWEHEMTVSARTGVSVFATLNRLGNALDRRRVLAYAAMLLVVETSLAVFVVAGTHGLLNFSGERMSTDFVSFYAAGTLADENAPAMAYHPAEHFLAEQQARNPSIEYNYFYYPPVFLVVCAALAHLPYIPAFLIFESATLALYLLVMSEIVGETSRASLAAIIAFPIVFWNFGWGQNAFLTAAIFGGATLFIDSRPIVAGLLFGAICYKPHFGLLIPVALASGRHWRAFFAAALSAAGLIVLSLVLFGGATWRDFITSALRSPATYIAGKVKLISFITPFGTALFFGASPMTAYMLQALAAIGAAVMVGLVWYRRTTLGTRAAMLASATLVAVPIGMFYDLLLGAVAAAWLHRSKTGLTASEKLMVAGCYLLLFAPDQVGEFLRVPMGAVAAGGLLITVARHALVEAYGRTDCGLSSQPSVS